MLDENEYKIYEAFKEVNKDTTIDNFMNYIEELIDSLIVSEEVKDEVFE